MQIRQGPYVISEDVQPLLNMWAARHDFRLPRTDIFERLRSRLVTDLHTCLARSGLTQGDVLYLGFDDLRRGITAALEANRDGAPLVSLDHLYFPEIPLVVDVTRRVRFQEGKWVTLDGVGVRATRQPVNVQVQGILDQLPAGTNAVRLVDDGLWTGTTTLAVRREFQSLGVAVNTILVALMVETPETCEALVQRDHPDIQPLVRRFSMREGGVIDWVCERDFYPGVPLGGRTVAMPKASSEIDVGAYYLDLDGSGRFGCPKQWATLAGGGVAEFSKNRLLDVRMLFETIENESGKPVLLRDLDRIPYGFPFVLGARFVDLLDMILEEEE